ncbi:hypothetical protein HK097_006739 [Rhizophlyctis rosea]|uniref:Methyltransferase domain-containing protein n=1 Tax=Rhizophlyctis rosea TaxID=64517 RepID=A0AAD5SFN5_9FUNG|nr:hypothetical protein HK097_006739 [Rhizophlyctis rosea]
MGICHSSEPPPVRKQPSTPSFEDASAPSSTRSRADSFKFDTSGRRLHADFTPLDEEQVASGRLYILPNDDEEMERLHIQHYMLRLLFKSNFSAPVQKMLSTPGAKVLDLGCGSGIWAFEIATDYPQCQVTGLDMSPVQPGTVKPKNVEYMQADLTNLPLPFEDASFDFIHMRLLIAGLRAEFWPVLIAEIVRLVKPGGYIELTEPTNPAMNLPTKFPNLMQMLTLGLVVRGCDLDISHRLKSYCEQQPELADIRTAIKDLHARANESDPDSKKISKMFGDDLTGVLMGVKAPLVQRGVCAEEEYDDLLRNHVAETLASDHVVTWTRCYGRRRGGILRAE